MSPFEGWLTQEEASQVWQKIDWTDNRFSFDKMLIMSIFSWLSYQDVREYERADRALLIPCIGFQRLIGKQIGGFQEALQSIFPETETVQVLDIDGFAVYVVMGPDVTIVSVRGTTNLDDWLINLKLLESGIYPESLHAGFAETAHRILDALATKRLLKRNLFVTGHSLGGATSAICLRFLHDHSEGNNREKRSLSVAHYGFGSPRIIVRWPRRHIERVLQNCSYFCVRDNDPVTVLPPKFMGFKDAFNIFDVSGTATIPNATVFSGHFTNNWAFSLAHEHKIELYIDDIVSNLRGDNAIRA